LKVGKKEIKNILKI